MNQEQRNDLAGLATKLIKCKPPAGRDFDMADWDCGTTACAIGCFCLWNPRDRLQITLDNKSDQYGNNQLRAKMWLDGKPQKHTMEAVAKRFGITFEDAYELFGNSYHDSGDKKDVAQRIRWFLKTKTARSNKHS